MVGNELISNDGNPPKRGIVFNSRILTKSGKRSTIYRNIIICLAAIRALAAKA